MMCNEGDGMRSWYSRVAARLLQDRLLLTALELHTELVEAGHEEPQLREFFSNPANFERPAPDTLVRCPSQATLDSLDLTRLSEDSERSDDVAVLEFELRKAKETINALRANLTQVAGESFGECDSNSVELGFERVINEDAIKPHERRALNFLIYEYLLQQDCKITSITFSDEVTDQDFECWDDVGLNIPRPAGLISMFRGENVNHPSKSNCNKETQTDEPTLNESNSTYHLYSENKSAGNEDSFVDQNEEIVFLKKQILALETDKVNYQKLYDAALASLNSLTSPTSDVPSSETTLYNREDNSVDIGPHYTCEIDNEIEDEMQPLPQNATQNYYGSSVSTNSLTPDQFEMIDSDKNGGSSQKDGSNVSSFEPAVMIDDHMVCSPKSSREPSHKQDENETIPDDTISFNDQIENDWEREQIIRNMKTLTNENFVAEGKNEAWINSDLPNEYKLLLMKLCDIKYNDDNICFKDIPNANQPINLQNFVNIVSMILPKIIPNILLIKRDEVIPLLICTIFLQTDQSLRDKLLQLLLNLRKKMEKDDRSLIISGLVLLLRWNIETNYGIDSDLLGFFWEMLNSKSTEKRILGAEASVALAPYISLELVNSLLLSMVLSMCDSGDISIREQGLLGAIMICPTSDISKYSQIENVFFTLAFDSDTNISNLCISSFTPVLARIALQNGIFHTEFCSHLLERFSDLISSNNEQTVLMLRIMNNVLLFSLLHVVDTDVLKDRSISIHYDSQSTKKLVDHLANKQFYDLKFLMADESVDPLKLIQTFYDTFETDINLSWYEKDWLINKWFNKIIYLLINYKNPPNPNILSGLIEYFNNWSIIFGQQFVNYVMKPAIEAELSKIEQNLIKQEYRNQFSPALISVYLGFLNAENEDEEHVKNIIKRWCICCGMCSISPVIVGVPLIVYSSNRQLILNYALATIWQCIVHTSEQVRAFSGSLLDYLVQHAKISDDLLNSSIVPGLITLVSDSAIPVKCAAVKSLGSMVCRLELSSNALDKCWHTLESLAIEEKTNGGLGSFTTICLAKTFLKIIKNNDTSSNNKVLPNLVLLCYSPIFSSGNVSSINGLLEELLPALQLGTHKNVSDSFIQASLLPALRKLENMEQNLLSEHRSAIESLIHKITLSEQQVREHQSNTSTHHGTGIAGHTLPSLLANSESVGRRVTQMFQQSKPAMNLQNIFKKK